MTESRESSSAARKNDDINLANVEANVVKVSINGLGRTRNDLVVKQLRRVMSATNFEEMVRKSQETKNKFEKFGIFKDVDINIDTSSGQKNGYDVSYTVREANRVIGNLSTMVGTNDASILYSLRFPNVFGRAERIDIEYSHGTKNKDHHGISLHKPVNNNPDVWVGFGLVRNASEFPWSHYWEENHGVFADLAFPTMFGVHHLRWDGSWRDVECMGGNAAFAVRQQAGHSQKSSIQHMLTHDRRDDTVFTTHGMFMAMAQEIAGLGGDVQYLKQELEFHINRKIPYNSVMQFTFAGGCMKSLNNQNLRINDKFFLGGPLTLRGFNMKGAGPRDEDCALGADAFWLGSCHIYTHLPFVSNYGGIGHWFKTHAFCSVGNLTNLKWDSSFGYNLGNLLSDVRASCGVGIVMKLGHIARVELNYCLPLIMQQGDSGSQGLQFGVGLKFL